MSTSVKKIALTFDDGPNPPYTNQILDILKKEVICATFFVCGANAKRHPDIIKRIASEGHQVGNHTYYHHRLPTLLGLNYPEIEETQKLINHLTGQKQKLFRPPWGHMPFWLKSKLEKNGYKIIPYEFEGDWDLKKNNMTSEEIVQKVIKNTKNNSIILLHDGHNIDQNANREQTAKALPKIISSFKKQNVQFILA